MLPRPCLRLFRSNLLSAAAASAVVFLFLLASRLDVEQMSKVLTSSHPTPKKNFYSDVFFSKRPDSREKAKDASLPMPISESKSRESSAAARTSNRGGGKPMSSTKKILYYNAYFDMRSYNFGFGQRPFVDYGCKVTNCYTTQYRSLLPSIADFDAVMFHLGSTFEMPKERKPHQRYVMFMMESPLFREAAKYNGFFNWTMTYRLDSDFPRPYGWAEDLEHPRHLPPRFSDLEKWALYDKEAFVKSLPSRPPEFLDLAKRPKSVAWIVSHCRTRSNREGYVREMQKYIDVDIMGGCSPVLCDQNHRSRSDNCTNVLTRDYKFFLSFENAMCKQYVTEKFWRRLGNDVVPIVMGRANYSLLAPPHSFVDVEDFDSPRSLSLFLLSLMSDRDEYLSYFWWRDKYRAVESDRKFSSRAMCELCRKLNDPQEPEKVIQDLDGWWHKDQCQTEGLPWGML